MKGYVVMPSKKKKPNKPETLAQYFARIRKLLDELEKKANE